MKLRADGGGNFVPHPETEGTIKGVIVDVTPPREITGEYGTKQVFQIVYETSATMDNGDRYTVRSAPFGCSLHEKSKFRPELKKIRGHDLSPAELAGDFDTETLIGHAVNLIVTHEVSKKDGKTYAVVGFVAPDKGTVGEKLTPSGKYVRMKDRPAKDDAKASYRKAATPDGEGREDWQRCKVHVGRHAGLELGDLEQEAVEALIEHWVPECEAKDKPTADDRRLLAALKAAAEVLQKAATATTNGEGKPF